MRNAIGSGGEIGALHQDGTEGDGLLVESYVYRGPDWTVKATDGSEQVIKAGDWLVGVIWSDDAWAAFKSGESTGVSMQGAAVRKTPSPADLARVQVVNFFIRPCAGNRGQHPFVRIAAGRFSRRDELVRHCPPPV